LSSSSHALSSSAYISPLSPSLGNALGPLFTSGP